MSDRVKDTAVSVSTGTAPVVVSAIAPTQTFSSPAKMVAGARIVRLGSRNGLRVGSHTIDRSIETIRSQPAAPMETA